MASLTLTVGTFTSSITATDINATRVLGAFLRSSTRNDDLASMTDQQKLDLVLKLIMQRLVSAATIKERQEAQAASNVPTFS